MDDTDPDSLKPTFIHKVMCTCTYIYVHMLIMTCTQKYSHICIHTNIALFHIDVYAKSSSNACMHTYIIYKHRCTQTYTHINTHTFIQAH